MTRFLTVRVVFTSTTTNRTLRRRLGGLTGTHLVNGAGAYLSRHIRRTGRVIINNNGLTLETDRITLTQRMAALTGAGISTRRSHRKRTAGSVSRAAKIAVTTHTVIAVTADAVAIFVTARAIGKIGFTGAITVAGGVTL